LSDAYVVGDKLYSRPVWATLWRRTAPCADVPVLWILIMANLLTVHVTNGVPDAGTGNVSTIDTLYGYNPTHLNTVGTTTIKSGAGFLHLIAINQTGQGSSTCTVFDSLSGSGTVLAVLNTLSQITSILYDITFSTGLTVVVTGTTQPPDLTVSWR